MMNIFNKAKGLRKQNALKPQLTSIGLKFPHTNFSTTKALDENSSHSDFQKLIRQIPLKDLIEERVETTDYMHEQEREEFLKRYCKVDRSTIGEKVANSQKKIFESYGNNSQRIIDSKLIRVVDALKSHPISRPSFFSYQSSLDNYKFKDGRDYQVLQRTDELEALSRLNYIELENSHFLNKMKHVVKDGEHFSMFEGSYLPEDYLEGKPDSYLIVQNFPANASQDELYLLLGKYGKIKKFNLRRTPLGYPAFFEVLFENAESVAKAKKDLNRKRYNGKVLYLKDHNDKSYEHPINRTLVIQGIERTNSAQDLLEKLSKFGAIVNFELATEIKPRAAPSKDELFDYLNQKNLSEDEKKKITLEITKFKTEGSFLNSYEESEPLLENSDLKENYEIDTARKDNHDKFSTRLSQTEAAREEKYKEIVFGDSLAKTYRCVEDASVLLREIPNIYSTLSSRQRAGSLQYFIKEIQDIKRKISKASQLSLQQKISINNTLETPEVLNKGYLFITYATTDQAKQAMLEIPFSFDFSYDTKVSLKKNNSHIDFDAEFFEEHYIKLKDKLLEEEALVNNKISESDSVVKSKIKIDEFKNKLYGNNPEEFFRDSEVKKSNLDNSTNINQIIQNAQLSEKEKLDKIHSELDRLAAGTVDQNFSDKPVFESELKDEEYNEVGRSFSTKINQKDFQRFFDQLLKKEARQSENLSDPKNYHDALTDLARKIGGDLSEDSEILKKYRQFLQDKNKDAAAYEKQGQEFMADAKRYQQNRDSREFRKQRAIERRQAQQETSEENAYFNPFINQIIFNKRGEDKNQFANASYEERKARFLSKVNSAVRGEYDESHLVDLIRVSQNEDPLKRKLEPYVLETDKDGYRYITDADIQRFEEDNLPEDPVERARYEASKKRKEFLATSSIADESREIYSKHPELGVFLQNQGLPVDSFVFEPTEEYKTAQEMAKNLNFLDPDHDYLPYENSDKSYLVKVAKKKNKFDIDFFQQDTPEGFKNQIASYLLENGMSQEDLDALQRDDFEGEEDRLNELNAKVLEILSNKIPANILEFLTTETPGTINQDLLEEIEDQIEYEVAKQKLRGLEKDDLIKYSSLLFNIQLNDKGFKRSKYDDL